MCVLAAVKQSLFPQVAYHKLFIKPKCRIRIKSVIGFNVGLWNSRYIGDGTA